MTIAKKYADQYMPNGEVSLESLIQAAIDESIRQMEAERATPEMCKAGSAAVYWDMTFDTEDAGIVYTAMRKAAAPAQEKV